MTQRVVLLGAAGIIGTSIARLLAQDAGVELLLADARGPEVRTIAKELGASSGTVQVEDREATVQILKGADWTVNATLYYQNLAVMEACAAAGSHYLDLGGLYHTTMKQLELDGRFRRAERTAVLGVGKAPGITNVLAASGALDFDTIEAVHLRSGRRALDDAAGFALPYSAQTLIDEFTLRPVVLRDGRRTEVAPLSGRETVHHPPPLGDVDYVTTLHSELATLPEHVGRGVRQMEFKVGLTRATTDALEQLVRLGFARTEPVTAGGTVVRPRDVTVAVLSGVPVSSGPERWAAEAELVGSRGRGERRRLLSVAGDEQQNGTALGAVAALDVLRSHPPPRHGVLAPEGAIAAEPFLARLASFGLSVASSDVELP